MIEIEAPTGEIIEFPDGTDDATILRVMRENFGSGERVANGQGQDASGGALQTATQGFSGFNEGLANVLGLPVDIVNRALGLVGLDSERPFLGSAQIRDAFDAAGTIAPETDDSAGRFARRVGQEIGATVVPAGGVLAAGARAGSRALPFLQQAAQAPGRFAATEAGLATSSGVGAATARDIAPDSPAAEVAGQVVGSFAPAGAVGTIRTALRGGPRSRARLEQSVQDFGALGTSPSVAQGTGSTGRAIIERAFSTVPGGMQVTNRVVKQQQRRVGKFVTRLADGVAPRADPTTAGQTIQKGIDDFLGRFRVRARALYGRLGSFIPADSRVSVGNTLGTLDNVTAPIPGAENVSGELLNTRLGRIAEGFRVDAADGTVPFSALQGLRTRVGEMLGSKELIDDIPRGQLKQVYAAMTRDMAVAARAAGPGAVRALNNANRFYGANITKVDDFLRPLANKNLPEDAFRLATRGRDGATQIKAVRSSLTKQQWNVVASAVLKRLGRARSSAQDDLGETFSTETFLTNWNTLDKTAKDALFKGVGPSLRKDLDKIARVASKIRESGTVLANPSGSAAAGINAATILLGAMGALQGNVAAVSSLGIVISGSALAQKALTNPRFVGWLAKATEIPVERLPGHLVRLTSVARTDPEVAEAVSGLLGALRETIGERGD